MLADLEQKMPPAPKGEVSWYICVHWVHKLNVEDNMMRMKQTTIYKVHNVLQVHMLRWHICRSWGVPGLEWYHPYRLAACQSWLHTYPRSWFWTGLNISVVHDLVSYARNTLEANAAFERTIPELCLSFWLSGMLIRSMVEVQCYASNSCGFATNM
jgi:hypothetical protein